MFATAAYAGFLLWLQAVPPRGLAVPVAAAFVGFATIWLSNTVSHAEVLKAAGYSTAMFHSGRFDYLGMREVVTDRGFDVLRDAGAIPNRVERPFGIDEDSVVDVVLEHLDAVRGSPAFVAYLPIAGHHPYVSPGAEHRAEGPERERYRSDLTHGDRAIGRLFEGLRARGLWNDTLFVLHGDHGEAFGEHDANCLHTFRVYQENVYVPLFIVAPGSTISPARVPNLVALPDVAPTVVDLLGLEAPASWEGVSALRPQPRVIHVFADYGVEQFALVDDCWKLVWTPEAGRPELYNLTLDPSELVNVASDHRERVARYVAEAARMRGGQGRRIPGTKFGPEGLASRPMTHLQHTGQLSDDRLAQLATAHLVKSASLQLVAELLTRLREMNFPWWTPEQLRRAYPAVERMRWLDQRPDVRQRITTQLTGLAPRAARNKSPDFQAELIDSVIDEGDIALDVFESAFEPADLAVYGPAEEYFQLFKRRMPWEDDSTPHQDLVGWLMGAFIADKSALDNSPRTPVLSALDVRTSIDGVVWHSRVPLHVRVAIDEARFASQRERPYEPFTVDRDLTIATPALIAASIPLKDLLGVIDLATIALGFEDRGGREHAARSPAATLVAEGSDDGPRPGLLEEPAAVNEHALVSEPALVTEPAAAVDPAAMSEPALVGEPGLVSGTIPPTMMDEPTGAAEESLEQATMKRHDSLSLSDGWEALSGAPVAPPAEGSASELESTGRWQSGAEAAGVGMDDDGEDPD